MIFQLINSKFGILGYRLDPVGLEGLFAYEVDVNGDVALVDVYFEPEVSAAPVIPLC